LVNTLNRNNTIGKHGENTLRLRIGSTAMAYTLCSGNPNPHYNANTKTNL